MSLSGILAGMILIAPMALFLIGWCIVVRVQYWKFKRALKLPSNDIQFWLAHVWCTASDEAGDPQYGFKEWQLFMQKKDGSVVQIADENGPLKKYVKLIEQNGHALNEGRPSPRTHNEPC